MTNAILGGLILIIVVGLFVIKIIPAPVTAILGCAAFSLFGICDISDSFSGFSNPVVILVASMMIFGSAMKKTGLTEIIGKYVIGLSRGSERLFILFGCICAALLSAFISNTAVNTMFLATISAITHSDLKIKRMNLAFPIIISTMIGGASTLIGSTTQLTAVGILVEKTEMTFDIFDFVLPGVIIFVAFLFFALFIGYPIGCRIWGGREENEEEYLCNQQTCSKKHIIILAFIFFAFFVVFIDGRIDITLAAVIVALLCIITGCTDFKSGLQAINWPVIFVLAGCLGITRGLSICSTDKMIGDFILGLIGKGTSVIHVYMIIVVTTMVISNIISNSASVMIILPIAISLSDSMNMNLKLFAVGIIFAASLSFSTPFANAQMGLALSVGYKFSDYIRYTWILNIIILVIIIFVFPILMPITI